MGLFINNMLGVYDLYDWSLWLLLFTPETERVIIYIAMSSWMFYNLYDWLFQLLLFISETKHVVIMNI